MSREEKCAECGRRPVEAYVLGAQGKPVWLCLEHWTEALRTIPVASRDNPVRW